MRLLPLAPSPPRGEGPEPSTINVRYPVPEWINRVKNLLSWHRIQLIDGNIWLVRADEYPVHVYPASPN